MRKERTLFIMGIWVAILPHLGFFESWRKILFFITGLGIVYLAYIFYTEAKVRIAKNSSINETKSFIDNMENSL